VIVADVNLVAHLFIEGEMTGIVQRMRETDPEWIVPPLWRIEFQSVLWKWIRHGGMSVDDAGPVWERALAALAPLERQPPWNAVLREAVRRDITVYDSQYVTLALHLGTRCITLDRDVLRKCPDVALPPDRFLSPPDGMIRETSIAYSPSKPDPKRSSVRRRRRANG
jgi:predicted nucleic acid-binding protein